MKREGRKCGREMHSGPDFQRKSDPCCGDGGSVLSLAVAWRLGVATAVRRRRIGPVGADRRAVEQILTNLLANAIKHSDGSQVTIRCYAENEETAGLEIEDNGIGIPSEHFGRAG